MNEIYAVLYRTNAVGEALNRALLKAGMPVTYGDGTSFLAEPPFTVISDLLQLQLNPENRIALSDLLSETYGWSQAQITSLLSTLNESNSTLFGDDPLQTISEPLQQELIEIRQVHAKIKDLLAEQGLQAVIEYIFAEFLPDEMLTETQQLKKQTLLIYTDESDPEVQEFLEQMQLNPYTDAGRIRAEGVHLLTFHAAKGLEFSVVIIAAAEEEVTPILREGTDLEEERRLFYVAMTRAEDELQITYAAERSRFGEVRKMEASRFIYEIPGDLTEQKSQIDSNTEKNKPANSEQLGLF
ncbi:MAG: ATP-dependent helicase [Balneolaceae bacterium]|nr:ATP-dependent helicase [Balneolaceae bacterium]